MSTHSIVSLPPQLEMTPKSLSLIFKKNNDLNDTGNNHPRSRIRGNIDRCSTLPLKLEPESRMMLKLSEHSFTLSPEQAVNLKIMLHADQMSSSRIRKVNSYQYR